jgi:hypothetical protein
MDSGDRFERCTPCPVNEICVKLRILESGLPVLRGPQAECLLVKWFLVCVKAYAFGSREMRSVLPRIQVDMFFVFFLVHIWLWLLF